MNNGQTFDSIKEIKDKLPLKGEVAAVKVGSGFQVYNAAIIQQLRQQHGEENAFIVTNNDESV